MKKLFISAIALSTSLALAAEPPASVSTAEVPTSEHAESDGDSAGTELPSFRPFSAQLELESGRFLRSAEQKNFIHSLYFTGGWQWNQSWKLGLVSQGEFVSQAPAAENGFRDSELSVSRTGLSLGQYADVEVAALSILPTDLSERQNGMIAAPGASVSLESTPLPRLTISYKAMGARFLRSNVPEPVAPAPVAAKSESADEEEEEVAEAETPEPEEEKTPFDRWRVENNLAVSYKLTRKLRVETAATHTMSWKWLSGREADFEMEQRVAYDIGRYKLGLGHRIETKVLSQSGSERRVALFRPEESKFFGTLTWTL